MERQTCPRCGRNDHVSNYWDYRSHHHHDAAYYDAALLRCPSTGFNIRGLLDLGVAPDDLHLNRYTILLRGYVGKSTKFCFFNIQNDNTPYICNYEH
ncbi:unnamed protein product [Adineta steineri]|uniref:Uncharacterized protein n=1 Tax=Adineta steineri TaxID=433720 RepID=A0A815RN41_9BILA|nr:unnamed protein product [Adineta steineri]